VTSIIAVASGKGGVGKSTVAANLAIALGQLGLKVGLMDADIYGPSVPRLFDIREKPKTTGKKIIPIEKYGIKIMSLGFLVREDEAVVWRGPMVQSALTQMLNDSTWAPLDILVIDMPPGTGDAQLTISQRVPLRGAIIVSTPQDLALIDARKGLAMFSKTQVHVHLSALRNGESHLRAWRSARRSAQACRAVPGRNSASARDPRNLRFRSSHCGTRAGRKRSTRLPCHRQRNCEQCCHRAAQAAENCD
jgi:MinD superfamily P-loop ATPase